VLSKEGTELSQLSSYTSGILLVYSACALGLLRPGPNILSVIGTSMGAGRKAGIYVALGVSAGTPIWAVATSIGLTRLLAAYAGVLMLIRIVGGLFLLWIACKAFRSAASSTEIHELSFRHRSIVRGATSYAD
jgi:amino acid exporter